jgi:hypothetical protein
MPAINEKEFTPTTWGGNKYEELTVPSGQRCLVRRTLDIKQMVENGIINKIDTLTALVDNKHVSRKAKGGKNSAKSQDMQNDVVLKKIMNDPVKFAELLETTDKIVIAIVVMPQLHEAPENDSDRQENIVYIDTVDLEDKLFLVNFAVGGTRGVAKFRRELQQSVERLADGEGVPEETE